MLSVIYFYSIEFISKPMRAQRYDLYALEILEVFKKLCQKLHDFFFCWPLIGLWYPWHVSASQSWVMSRRAGLVLLLQGKW